MQTNPHRRRIYNCSSAFLDSVTTRYIIFTDTEIKHKLAWDTPTFHLVEPPLIIRRLYNTAESGIYTSNGWARNECNPWSSHYLAPEIRPPNFAAVQCLWGLQCNFRLKDDQGVLKVNCHEFLTHPIWHVHVFYAGNKILSPQFDENCCLCLF